MKPSLRPNPSVPAACNALSYSKTVAGLAHEYTLQAKAAGENQETAENPVSETPAAEETPVVPGMEPAPPGAPVEPTEEINTTVPYYMYGAFENGGYHQPSVEEEEVAPGEEKKEKRTRARTEVEAPSSFIAAGGWLLWRLRARNGRLSSWQHAEGQ